MLSELQNNNQSDPQLEQLVLKLQFQLRNSKGKKVYGYLQPNIKKTVDQIIAELARNPVLKKMYDEWCALEQQKYETYTSAVQKFPSLEENRVFKPIKNAVIQAVLQMDNPVQELDSEMFVEVDEENLGEAQSSNGFYIKPKPKKEVFLRFTTSGRCIGTACSARIIFRNRRNIFKRLCKDFLKSSRPPNA